MLKSKFFRVAKAGKTVDGREITSQHIDQMAANYDLKKYGSRIWNEHIRGILPDGLFKALGDVIALSTETDNDGAKYLTAQLSPTADLLKMNADRQKVYTSIEIDPDFSDTGEAYLVGLAVTDSPASLGTAMLQFSMNNRDKFSQGSELPNSIFSETLECEASDFEELEAPSDPENIFSKVKAMLGGKVKGDEKRFSQNEDSLLKIAESVSALSDKLNGLSDNSSMSTDITALQESVSALTEKLSAETAPGQQTRPLADGTGGHKLTDC